MSLKTIPLDGRPQIGGSLVATPSSDLTPSDLTPVTTESTTPGLLIAEESPASPSVTTDNGQDTANPV